MCQKALFWDTRSTRLGGRPFCRLGPAAMASSWKLSWSHLVRYHEAVSELFFLSKKCRDYFSLCFCTFTGIQLGAIFGPSWVPSWRLSWSRHGGHHGAVSELVLSLKSAGDK